MRRIAFFLFALLLAPPALADVAVRDVRLGLQEGGATRFVVELDRAADYRLFLLEGPARAVIDLPTLNWSQGLSPQGRGLVRGWRHGQFGEGTRVVLDLAGPVKVIKAEDIPALEGTGRRLVIDLAAAPQAEFAGLINKFWGGRKEASIASVITASAPVMAAGVMLPPPLPERRRAKDPRPMIVIDAGHGGVDPGAIAVTGHREKDITLSVARKLAKALEESGRYRVKLTRNRDVFIPLEGRVRIARQAGADLFLSLHADSIRGRDVRGATVYTLSDRASDKEAAELAESENRADALAGLQQAGSNDTLANILIDMSSRASLNHGRDFATLLVGALREQTIRLNDNPHRAAGFAVLKAPDVPSVLVEMGYLSSRRDAMLLTQAEHQQRLVQAQVTAIDRFFARHRPRQEALAVLP